MTVLQAGDAAPDLDLINQSGQPVSLASLESRLTNDEETEQAIVADQLRQIALLRLAKAVSV